MFFNYRNGIRWPVSGGRYPVAGDRLVLVLGREGCCGLICD